LYDTIALKSPYLTENQVSEIYRLAKEKEGMNLKITSRLDWGTGELDYKLTTGKLLGSFDSRISVRVDDTEYRVCKTGQEIVKSMGCKCGNKLPERVKTDNYIYIEASVHKVLLGHNIFGGPIVFSEAVRQLIDIVQELIGVELPACEEWRVMRVDVAEVFLLHSFEAVEEFFKGLQLVRFPRREKNKSTYGQHGMNFNGSTTSVKLYHKGVEFWKHDRKRLGRYIDEKSLLELIEIANRILRVEVEIKRRKLSYDFGDIPLVSKLTDEYLNNIYDSEIKKLLKEGEEMEIVRDAYAVERRLNEVYNSKLAGILLGTWMKLTTLGESHYKSNTPYRTYKRHIKQLRDAGVSWLNTDVRLEGKRLVPVDFKPLMTDIRKCNISFEEAVRMIRKTA